jgi:DNA binding domain, excisionase family
MEKLLLTVPEVLEQLRISRATLYVLKGRGEIPFVHIGSRALIRKEDLDNYVRALVS